MGWISAMKAPCHEVFELNKAQSTMAGTVVSWIRNFIPWKWGDQNIRGKYFYAKWVWVSALLLRNIHLWNTTSICLELRLWNFFLKSLRVTNPSRSESRTLKAACAFLKKIKFPHQRPDVRILVVIFVKHSQAWNKPKSETDIFKSLPCWPWHW